MNYLTEGILKLIYAVEELPKSTNRYVDISLPRGIGKTTAIVELMTQDDCLVLTDKKHWEQLLSLEMQTVAVSASGIQMQRASGRKAYRERIMQSCKMHTLPAVYYEDDCLLCIEGCQPPQGLIGRGRMQTKRVYVDEPKLAVQRGRGHDLMDYKRKLMHIFYTSADKGFEPTIVFLSS